MPISDFVIRNRHLYNFLKNNMNYWVEGNSDFLSIIIYFLLYLHFSQFFPDFRLIFAIQKTNKVLIIKNKEV